MQITSDSSRSDVFMFLILVNPAKYRPSKTQRPAQVSMRPLALAGQVCLPCDGNGRNEIASVSISGARNLIFNMELYFPYVEKSDPVSA
jgi:hypothetical protein